MFWKTFSGTVIACGLLGVTSLHLLPGHGCPGAKLLSPSLALADEKKDDKLTLSGNWDKKDAELKIEFADKKVMKILPHGDKAMITIVCEYTVDKEGHVKATVTELEANEEIKKKVQAHVPVGLKFDFKWKAEGDTAKLEDLKGDNTDTLKSRLEGDFEKK